MGSLVTGVGEGFSFVCCIVPDGNLLDNHNIWASIGCCEYHQVILVLDIWACNGSKLSTQMSGRRIILSAESRLHANMQVSACKLITVSMELCPHIRTWKTALPVTKKHVSKQINKLNNTYLANENGMSILSFFILYHTDERICFNKGICCTLFNCDFGR